MRAQRIPKYIPCSGGMSAYLLVTDAGDTIVRRIEDWFCARRCEARQLPSHSVRYHINALRQAGPCAFTIAERRFALVDNVIKPSSDWLLPTRSSVLESNAIRDFATM